MKQDSMSAAKHTPGSWVVQQTRYGKHVCFVGAEYATKELAEQACANSYRADWERAGRVTPVTHYAAIAKATGSAS